MKCIGFIHSESNPARPSPRPCIFFKQTKVARFRLQVSYLEDTVLYCVDTIRIIDSHGVIVGDGLLVFWFDDWALGILILCPSYSFRGVFFTLILVCR